MRLLRANAEMVTVPSTFFKFSGLPRFAPKDEGWIAALRSQRRDPINTLNTLRDEHVVLSSGRTGKYASSHGERLQP